MRPVASDVVVGVALVGMAVLAAMVLGTVGGRERFAFVAGVGLVLLGQTLLEGAGAGLVALAGLVAVLASTVPLFRG